MLGDDKLSLFRVHITAIDLYSKMKVRARGIACTADIAYVLPSHDPLTAFYMDLAKVSVNRLQALSMRYDDAFAKTSVPAR